MKNHMSTNSCDQFKDMWQPVPPTPNHVGMGMIATTDANEPSQHAMRCVRRELVVRSTRKPVKIWDNSGGAAGQKGSLWTINSLGVC